MLKVVEAARVTSGPLAGDKSLGYNGAFIVPNPSAYARQRVLIIIASDGGGWEHVSVHVMDSETNTQSTPTWDEMCHIKNLFWSDDECVIQYHPPAANYVNNHPYTLHLWKPVGIEIPQPPSIMVGNKDMTPEDFLRRKPSRRRH